MKIMISESQLNHLMGMDEVGTMGSKRWDFKSESLKNMMKSHHMDKQRSEGKLNYLWKNKLKLDNLMDYAFGDDILINVYLHNGNMVLGQIILEKFEDGYSIVDIHISEELSGKEIGINIYLNLVKILNKPLYSGSSQTVFSKFGIWKKLMNRFPDRVVGYHNGNEQELEMRGGELYAGDCEVYSHDEDCGDVRLKLK